MAKRDREGGAGDWRRRQWPREAQAAASSARGGGVCELRVPRVEELQRREATGLPSQPREVAWFSKSGPGQVSFDRSNLARYKEPKVGVDLLEGFSGYVSKDEADPSAPPAPLGPYLDTICHFQVGVEEGKRPHFVTFRNNLNKIMGTPYNTNSEWVFAMEKRDGCVYLDVRRTQQEIESNRNPHVNQRRGAYAGRRFELYATYPVQGGRNENEGPSTSDRHVDEDTEIDCYAEEARDKQSQEYVELKTFRLLEREKDRYVFERFKLLAFWIQSYLVGTPKIVCGFRDDNFVLKKLQVFKTADLPSFARKYWSPNVCVNFTKMLLDWIYDTAEEGLVYTVSYWPRRHVVEMAESIGESSFLPAH